MLYNKILSEHQQLEQEIHSMQEKISQFPQGKLVCTQNAPYIKWYQSDSSGLHYIPKKNRQLAEQLAVKKYLTMQLEELLQEKEALDLYLQHHNQCKWEAVQLLSEDSPFSELLASKFTVDSDSEELQKWAAQAYDRNETFPEQCTHKTTAGILVRSKSEALITMLLHINRIPFRYECALPLGESVIYPDFTIRHPSTGEVFYWEHFGMMDQPNYRKNAFGKLRLYAEHGIYPSMQLLTTYETKDCPMDSGLAEQLVHYYFL